MLPIWPQFASFHTAHTGNHTVQQQGHCPEFLLKWTTRTTNIQMQRCTVAKEGWGDYILFVLFSFFCHCKKKKRSFIWSQKHFVINTFGHCMGILGGPDGLYWAQRERCPPGSVQGGPGTVTSGEGNHLFIYLFFFTSLPQTPEEPRGPSDSI